MPGRHAVTCSFPWIVFREAGKATVIVDVMADQIVDLTYVAPIAMFRPGRWDTGADAVEQRRPFPKAGPFLSACIGLFFAAGFIAHERPPTVGQLLAAVAAGVPAVALYAAVLIVRPVRRNLRPIVLGQCLATALLLAALVSQSVPRTAAWWVLLVILVVAPLAVTGREISRNRSAID